MLASLLEQMANQPSALDSYMIASASSMAITELRSLSAELARKDAALLAAEELAKAVGRNPRLIANLAFVAGTEESEGGSCRRQAQAIADYERRIAVIGAAVDAFRAAMEDTQ